MLPTQVKRLYSSLSKLPALPLLSKISPPVNHVPSQEELEGHLKTQRLAERAAKEVSIMMQEGWTEKQAAKLLDTYLKDSGVKSFFHKSFAWFGERAAFTGLKHYSDALPSDRVLLPDEPFILDVAPIYHGYIADIGYSCCLGENPEWKKAQLFLAELKKEIPLLAAGLPPKVLLQKIEEKIEKAGYENAHRKYPFSVLGHRVHQVAEVHLGVTVINFEWQSYWSLLSRGLFGQLFNEHFEGDFTGLWAIEPHLGAGHFGAKFEEILVVTKDKAYWLEQHREEKA